jgi:hypothetical protein
MTSSAIDKGFDRTCEIERFDKGLLKESANVMPRPKFFPDVKKKYKVRALVAIEMLIDALHTNFTFHYNNEILIYFERSTWNLMENIPVMKSQLSEWQKVDY